jgi:hypothetical protein
LTAITDNAALTYLGSEIVGISDESKCILVAGAVAGGRLTVIANAPNPARVALLRRGFADESIGAGELLLGAAGCCWDRARRRGSVHAALTGCASCQGATTTSSYEEQPSRSAVAAMPPCAAMAA